MFLLVGLVTQFGSPPRTWGHYCRSLRFFYTFSRRDPSKSKKQLLSELISSSAKPQMSGYIVGHSFVSQKWLRRKTKSKSNPRYLAKVLIDCRIVAHEGTLTQSLCVSKEARERCYSARNALPGRCTRWTVCRSGSEGYRDELEQVAHDV